MSSHLIQGIAVQVDRSQSTVDSSQYFPGDRRDGYPSSFIPEIHRTLLFRIISAVLTFFLVFIIVDYLVLSSFARILVEMETSIDLEMQTKIYYSTSAARDAFSERLSTELLSYPGGKRVALRFDLNNATIKRLRIDPGDKPGDYKIYSIELLSFFGKPIKIEPFDREVKVRGGPDTRVIKTDHHLEITSLGSDPYVIIDTVPSLHNPGLRLATPLVFAVLTYVVVGRIRLSAFQFWTDVRDKKPSSGTNYQALDGLRGLAAIFVLADHCGVPFCDGLGMVGVVVFFSLSGFLLTMPYADNGAKLMDAGYVKSYFLRRIRRIIPMYYVVILAAYFFNHRMEDFIRSALFLQGNTIYWTVQQEMHFYLLLLPVLLLNHLLLKDCRWLIVLVLLAASYGFNHNLLSTYRVYGMGQSVPIFAGIFLSGMAACYLYHIKKVKESVFLRKICSIHLLPVLLFGSVVLIHHFWSFAHNGARCRAGWVLSGDFNYLVAALLFVLVMSDTSCVARWLRVLPLRLIGLVSYSFYLLHPVFASAVKNISKDYFHNSLSNIEVFGCVLIVTFIVSTVTYTFVERPFLKMT